ncbi:hypothetical protein LR69_02058 [Geobacillus sp. BCO2]|nr:hypothetical protein LR69_02058 [Geobacillus sp. BCO2]
MFFLIPNTLFSSPQAGQLNEFLREAAIVQGVLQLPLSMFKHDQAAKSVFILQKKGRTSKKPKHVLLVELPRFSNKSAMQAMMAKIDAWITEEKGQ